MVLVIVCRGPPNLYTVWVTAGFFFVTVAVLTAADLVVVRKQAMIKM